MSRLSDIPVRIEPSQQALTPNAVGAGLGEGDAAILVELVDLLRRLADTNVSGAIDLHSLPMSDLDRARLQESLGRGEVRAFIDAEGLSEIQETAVPGVWWIQHRDRNFELIAELIEVTLVPAILARARDEISPGIALLKERINRAATRRIAPRHGH